MMDTSVLVTSLVRGHEHHARARAELPAVVSLPVMATALARATELDLAGNIHDALIALACVEHDLPIVTLDARQHQVALALGVRSTDLLA